MKKKIESQYLLKTRNKHQIDQQYGITFEVPHFD